MRRLRAVIGRARAADLEVVLDMHNYGAYYLSNGSEGVRRPIGSPRVSLSDFAEVWRRIARAFGDVEGVVGYALMAEPYDLPGRSPARLWEKASQKALDAIRGTGDDTLVSVAGYAWSSLSSWPRVHPDGWIEDPADNFLYEAHHYWDRDHSGSYQRSYDAEVAWSADRGY